MVKRRYSLNPFTNQLDATLSLSDLDDRYVNVTGDTMTGDLKMDGNAIWQDATSKIVKNGNTTELWVNGVLSASWGEDAPAITSGQPIGMLLGLTYTV